MKKNCLALLTALVLCLGLLPVPALSAGDLSVPVDRETFPDESFRSYVQTLPGAEDGVLTAGELARITRLDCNDRGITDLEGVRVFSDLEELNCPGNKLTALDVSGMPALTRLDCSRNFTLERLNASDCPGLTYLNCSRNVLTRLDIRRDAALEELCCTANFLPELNVSGSPALRELYCDENELIDLDVSRNPALIYLDCSINYMSEVDVSRNPALEQLTADIMNEDMTIFIPAEGVKLTELLSLMEGSLEIRGGSVDENGFFTFDRGSDRASFLYMRNTLTLRKPMEPVTETITTQSGVRLSVTTDHRGRLSAEAVPPAGTARYWVTVPMEHPTPGTAAVLLIDGEERVIRTSYPLEHGVRFPVDGPCTVKLLDRTRRFYDVPHYEWFRPYVDFASARKLFSGVAGGEFGPDVPLTRGMLVVVLHAMEDTALPGPEGNRFSDVPEGMWYSRSVAWAAGRGLISGYPDGRFGPDDLITREQLALILYNAMGRPAVQSVPLAFTDSAAVSPYALTAIRWAVANGVLSGVGGNRLSPGGTASRAEAAAVLMRYVSLLG